MKKKIQSIIFLSVITAIFIGCFYIMNLSYDSLSRYPFLSELTTEEKELMNKHLSSSDLDYVITQRIEPEVLFRYLEEPNFSLRNILWYHAAQEAREAPTSQVINFINNSRSRPEMETLSGVSRYLTLYSYETLSDFFNDKSDYFVGATLSSNPEDELLVLSDDVSVYTYVPDDLVNVENIPTINNLPLQIKEDVLPSLQSLCTDLQTMSNEPCGGLVATIAYTSYEEQVATFNEWVLQEGTENIKRVWDYPGNNEYQLGYMIHFQFKDDASTELKEAVSSWLSSNLQVYGFIERYPAGKENVTGKNTQTFTFRYVGTDIANTLHTENITLDEYIRK